MKDNPPLGNLLGSQRLDTLEELSEPASSEYWQPESIGSKGSSINTHETTTAGIFIIQVTTDPIFINIVL